VSEENGALFFEKEMAKLESIGVDFSHDIAGFMLETFQGWGAIFYPKSFVQALSTFAKKHGILLAFDEMQSGFGRTGKKFGFEHYEVEPDLIACGKGMGGGFPLSGVIGKREIMDLPEVGNMSSTHSANPIVTAAGLAVLEEIQERNLVEQSRIKGDQLHKGLEEIAREFPERVLRIQGKGLIAAIHFKDAGDLLAPEFASRVSERCMEKGLLVVHTGRESIKIGPPLTITLEALVEGVDVLRESMIEIENS
jgi:4-aminobutyrate aminotransferase-like enzyme